MGIQAVVGQILAGLPSPASDGFWRFRFYGALIALGMLAAILFAARRMPGRKMHPDVAFEIAMPALIGGVIGARLYHVITDWNWSEAWAIWRGGLGIPGGVLLGALAVVVFAKSKGYPLRPLLDVTAPTLPLAQAIGRWGNWFNQELYGRPTDLPWGLEIDPEHRVAGYQEPGTLFHPTFLYESLWNLALVVFMVWLDKKRVLKPGRLFLVYTAGYSIGRLWIEALRIDNATEIFGIRINIWTMTTVLVVSLIGLAVSGRRSPDEIDPYRVGEADGTGADPVTADKTADKTADEAADEADETADGNTRPASAAAGASVAAATGPAGTDEPAENDSTTQ